MSALPLDFASIEARAHVITTRSPNDEGIVWRVWNDVDVSHHEYAQVPTVILLHGSYGSWTHWLRNIPGLAKACRVVALDIPGFGDSGDAPVQRSPPDLARLIAEGWHQLRDQLLPQSADASSPLFIGGFSLGAVYAGWLTHCLRNSFDAIFKLSGLFLLAPGGLGKRVEKQLSLRPVAGHLLTAASAVERLAAHRHNLGVLMFGNIDKIDDLAVQIQDMNVSRARFRGTFTTRPDYLLEALRGLSLPVLGLWGEKDAFDVDLGMRVAALRLAVPDVTTAIVSGAGHWVGYEAPDEVNTIILNWINTKI